MRLFRRKIKNPILGTAHITSCGSPGNPQATRSRCVLFVVVEGPGITPASHEVHEQVLVARWPRPGMTVPCRIDPSDHGRFEIDLHAVPDWRDSAGDHAAQVAAARAAGGAHGASGGAPIGGSGGVTVIGAGSPAEAGAAVRQAETALGVDLDGDGRIG